MKRRMKIHWRFLLSYLIPGMAFLWIAGYFLLPEITAGDASLFSLFLGAVFLVIYGGVSRTILRPLEEIEEGVRRFAEGYFNWKIRLRDTRSELGVLSGRLNQMAEGHPGQASEALEFLGGIPGPAGGPGRGRADFGPSGQGQENERLHAGDFAAFLSRRPGQTLPGGVSRPGAQRSDPNDFGLGAGAETIPFLSQPAR